MWNNDLDISAFFFLLILIAFYVRRRFLPLHRNKLFLTMMFMCQAVAASNILATLITVAGDAVSLWCIYAANILYYCLLAACPAVFLFYCSSLTGYFVKGGMRGSMLAHIPMFLVFLAVISTPATHFIFKLDQAGNFTYMPGRRIIYFETCFYLVLCMLHVWLERRKLRRMCRYSIYIFSAVTFVGHTSQVFFLPYLQTVSLCMTLGILVMFLTYQNPDFYKDESTMLLNMDGFDALKEDDLKYGIHRKVAFIGFENYEELLNVYGDGVMRKILEEFSRFIRVSFPTDCQFYIHKGRFLLVAKHGKGYPNFSEVVIKRCRKPFPFENGEMMLTPYFVHSSEDIRFNGVEEEKESFHIGAREALRRGGQSVVKIDEEILSQAIHNVKVDRALEKAIHGDGLEVYYQPIYSTKEGRINSAEALVRIQDIDLGLVFPDEFIWKAEENGSILLLGQRVFEKVCGFIKAHDMEELGLSYIEVNLSPVQCMRKQLADEFKAVTAKYGVDPAYINLEITESGNTVSSVIHENMEALTFYGMSFSLDDYGTGFSNLVNIFSMPLRIVKIDKSIVWQYFKGNSSVLTHVLDIFKESHLEIVTEGVESLEMVEKLTELGVDYLQGYYFSKPIPETAFLEYIKTHKNIYNFNK